jgi:hypothetical protein
MNTIKTKFKAKQTVWLASIRAASAKKTRINCVWVKDYGDKTNIEYQTCSNWYDEEPNECVGLFATKKEADEFLLQGLPNFNALKKKRALQLVKFQEEQLEKAKAELAKL